jgi:hypothetical protein
LFRGILEKKRIFLAKQFYKMGLLNSLTWPGLYKAKLLVDQARRKGPSFR